MEKWVTKLQWPTLTFAKLGIISCLRSRLIFSANLNIALNPVLNYPQELVLDIYGEHAGPSGVLDYPSYVKAVAEHPVVVQFASGEGTERYGSGM